MPLRCLIVDDSPHFLEAASGLLEREGFAVVGVASTSTEAVQRVQDLEPDVALVDVQLGDESGIDLAWRIHDETGLEPSKVISDQYAASMIITSSGKTVVGRVTNYHDNGITLNTDMTDPNATVTVNRNDIESMTSSTTSMMPSGLLNTLNEDELLDLMAFLLSRGDSHNAMFAPKGTSKDAEKIGGTSVLQPAPGK